MGRIIAVGAGDESGQYHHWHCKTDVRGTWRLKKLPCVTSFTLETSSSSPKVKTPGSVVTFWMRSARASPRAPLASSKYPSNFDPLSIMRDKHTVQALQRCRFLHLPVYHLQKQVWLMRCWKTWTSDFLNVYISQQVCATGLFYSSSCTILLSSRLAGSMQGCQMAFLSRFEVEAKLDSGDRWLVTGTNKSTKKI